MSNLRGCLLSRPAGFPSATTSYLPKPSNHSALKHPGLCNRFSLFHFRAVVPINRCNQPHTIILEDVIFSIGNQLAPALRHGFWSVSAMTACELLQC